MNVPDSTDLRGWNRRAKNGILWRVKFGKTLDLVRALLVLTLVVSVAAIGSAVEQDLGQFLSSPATLALSLYKRFISPAKGSTCPMEPSDSTYAGEALRRYGLFRGSLMTADRLHRCGHDGSRYAIVRTPRGLKYFDPVDPAESRP